MSRPQTRHGASGSGGRRACGAPSSAPWARTIGSTGIDRLAGPGVARLHGAARVVAVEARGPSWRRPRCCFQGPSTRLSFGLASDAVRRAGVGRIVALHVEAVEVSAQPGDGPDLARPLDAGLEEGRPAALVDVVLADRLQALRAPACGRARRSGCRPAGPGGRPRSRCPARTSGERKRWLTLAPRIRAVVLLLELVAVHRVVEEVGEVREEVEAVVDGVGLHLREAQRWCCASTRRSRL